MKESLEFYNQFDNKLINDYAFGNKRLISAIESLSKYIPIRSKIDVLDIGCGLGWSTYEFSRFFDNSTFEGIDLSPVLIENARKLFQNQNLSYKIFDITKEIPKKKYDVIIMLDVYEHIPKFDRKDFHQSLLSLLNRNGRIIMACPTVYHQDYLKKNNPEGLQPVDEDINYDTLQELAKDIEGQVVYFEYKNIWRNYDYFYTVIQKGVEYNSQNLIKDDSVFQIEKQTIRLKRLKDNLGVLLKVKKGRKPKSRLHTLAKKIKKKISK